MPRLPIVSPVRFSHYVGTRLRPFPESQSERRQLNWLLRAGKDHPGAVLLPALDDLTWIMAQHQEKLRPYFRLYYPTGDAVYAVLNKETLHTAALASGIATPTAWFPASREEAAALAPSLAYPIVLKPRTHVGTSSWFKGGLVRVQRDFLPAYDKGAALLAGGYMGPRTNPADALPFVQAYTPGADARIYNLSGFLDHTGLLSGFLATRKVFQTPRRFGVGVCFEAAPVDTELAVRMVELLGGMGFFGMFEAEFIETPYAFLLIDLNPRVFNGLSLITERGLRLPLIWYLAALGDWAGVEEQLVAARRAAAEGAGPDAWCHRFVLETMVAARVATGRMGPAEARRWWGWVRSDRARTLEASWAPDDPWPGRMNGLQHAIHFVRDPRHFVGTFVRD